MSDANHTPGPITVSKCPCGDTYCDKWHLSSGTFYQGSGFTKEDAEFYAAAPDMYEALEPLADLAKHHAADAPEWSDRDSVTAIISIGDLRAATAALSKARGDSQ